MKRTHGSVARGAFAVTALVMLLGASDAFASFKIAHWNVQSGFGKGGWAGGNAGFTPGSDCSRNAWGNGSGPLARTLVSRVKDDKAVVALTVNEAWTCATPSRIRSLLGFAAATKEVNGVAIIARHGFAGNSEVVALPKCSGGAEQRYVVRAPVYTDSARSKVVQVFATHWTGCAAEGKATVEFLQRYAYQPRSLTGDLNVKSVSDAPIAAITAKNWTDAWSKLHGKSGGQTATWNNSYGSPRGNLYKRIDYALFKTLKVRSISRFNHTGEPGAAKMADHAGIVVEYDD
ncbi:MAG TPA: endonuclease/exonuclease/phosphatase family protein [Thermodesulfobacteriota bacterium]